MSRPQKKGAPQPEQPDEDSSDYSPTDFLLELLLPATMMAYLFAAPYTKVEESFNMQAIHDVANVGMPVPFYNVAESLAQYDHVEFPGVVPRSFAAPAFVGALTSVVLGFVQDGLIQQLIVRALIGLFNCSMMILFSRRAAAVYGKGAARWYLVLQASQFHVMYYASRTLPNMLAFGMVIYAVAEMLPPPGKLGARADWFDASPIGLQMLIVGAVIFRAELGLLFLAYLIPLVAAGWVSIWELLILGGVTGTGAVLTAVSVDTYFWQTWPTPMWAELQGFLFNTVQGRSAEYGVSPVHYYFTSAIPRLLLNPLATVVLLPLGVYAGGWQRTVQRLVGPSLGFVAAYSLLPHKEWRFIVYIVPALTLVAGVGADYLFARRRSSVAYAAASLALVTTVGVSFAAAGMMTYVSSLNYPGGYALAALEEVAAGREVAKVHMDVFTCMTGATRFTENTVAHPGWKFSKEERPEMLINPTFWRGLDYVVTSNPAFLMELFYGWEVRKVVKGYTRWELWGEGKDPVSQGDFLVGGEALAKAAMQATGGVWPVIRVRESLWILGRKAEEKIPGFEDVDLDAEPQEPQKPHDEL
ncbi:hypothetical protein DRE_05388 [Drechslerella stenobrocha 248]|uniref:Mannosyltransferase n=1 Tax=Drechslerella stenobrocha 248 TaxID=1043628 RepID=W7I943_9PEZI|nr:hypothetical protein DRE_05388 [Drechslerella stenobrocha 248]